MTAGAALSGPLLAAGRAAHRAWGGSADTGGGFGSESIRPAAPAAAAAASGADFAVTRALPSAGCCCGSPGSGGCHGAAGCLAGADAASAAASVPSAAGTAAAAGALSPPPPPPPRTGTSLRGLIAAAAEAAAATALSGTGGAFCAALCRVQEQHPQGGAARCMQTGPRPMLMSSTAKLASVWQNPQLCLVYNIEQSWQGPNSAATVPSDRHLEGTTRLAP